MSNHTEHVKLVAFVGLAGSGKTSAVDYVTEKGYPKVYFGGIMYQMMRDAGIEITFESQQEFREKIRRDEGMDIIAKHAIVQIEHLMAAGQHRIVLDGVYSWSEYKTLKHSFPGELELVAIVAPRRLRKHRLAERPERPLTSNEVDTRDWAEIEHIEKAGPIAIADHFIINDSSLESLHHNIDTTLESINFYD